jgi:nitroreductase
LLNKKEVILMLKELVIKNRTYRRFYENVIIEESTLKELIDLARLSSSAGNIQSLKYVLSCSKTKNNVIFPHLKWAGYLTDWDGPEEGERPSAYIIVLGDKEINSNHFWDHGLASQSILLGAVEKELGGCMFASIDKQNLVKALEIPDRYEILLVIALGKPKEIVVLEDVPNLKNVKYWRDENQIHHVPKRTLKDIILDI